MESVKLSQVQEGKLVKLNRNSDVYKVISNGFRVELLNMYTKKTSNFKPYTMKNNVMQDRKVEVVQFY